jgi:putative membrane protein
MKLITYLLLAWLANIVSLLVADWIFSSVTIERWGPLILGAAILGIANTIVKPILTLLTLPLVIVTLGLFYFVINVLMLALAEWIAPDFSIDGFWTYIGATIVISIVSWAMHGIFGMFEGSKSAQPAT